jgi:hypothetical protein
MIKESQRTDMIGRVIQARGRLLLSQLPIGPSRT